MSDIRDHLIEIAPRDVKVGYRVRKDDGDLATLEASIRKHGLLAPIVIDGDNVLICGARRLAACRNAGLATVPAYRVGVKAGGAQALDMQSDENLCRQPLSEAELDAHIRVKMSAGAKQGEGPSVAARVAGVVAGMKRFFGLTGRAKA